MNDLLLWVSGIFPGVIPYKIRKLVRMKRNSQGRTLTSSGSRGKDLSKRIV